jgi:hypothetical protein
VPARGQRQLAPPGRRDYAWLMQSWRGWGWMMSTLLPCISTHAAAQISSADRGAITQCLNASHTKNHCVGIVADACIKATSGDSQVEDAKACAVRERNVWAERLQASLTIVNDRFPALRPAMADAQANWLKSVGGLCPQFDDIDPGMYEGGGEYCRLQEVGRRALIIECMRSSRDTSGSAETCIDSLAGHCELAKGEDEKVCAARELADSKRRLQVAVRPRPQRAAIVLVDITRNTVSSVCRDRSGG